MSIFYQALDADFPEACRHGAITIGNFDGVHLGHQSLLVETMKQAHELAGPAIGGHFRTSSATTSPTRHVLADFDHH